MHQLNENCSTSLTCDMYLFGFVLKELILLKIMYAIIYNFWFLYYLMYCYLFIFNLKIVIFGIFTTIMLLLYFVLGYLPIIPNGSSLSKNIFSTTGITK
mgnify:CR=1 FL=1